MRRTAGACGRAPAAVARRHVGGFHGAALREADAAVDDDLVAVVEAFGNEPAVALPVADDDRAQLGLVIAC